MKVAATVVNARRQKVADRLRTTPYISLTEICRLLNISEATARRDLRYLEEQGEIQRTYGGAFGDYISRFPSFQQRMALNANAKKGIASVARQFIQPDSTCFFDAGTTLHALAQNLAENPITPLRVVTHSIPIAETLSVVEGIEVELLGGRLVPRQAVLLGKTSMRALNMFSIDHAFLGAEGFNEEGVWNSQADVILFQRQVMKRVHGHASFLLTSEKCAKTAPQFLARWDEIHSIVVDASPETKSFVNNIRKTIKQPKFFFAE